ncbi:MAG: hypothetical protein ABI707_07090 [Ferruginibacter sp.]
MAESKNREIITGKLVVDKTNKTIDEWFKILDKKGAKKMNHPEIFNLVSSIEGLQPLGQWNHNLLTTTYEWSRSLKERGQKENGFEISVSKTIEVPVNIIYNAWTVEKIRITWLGKENITIRKATENKSARISWIVDGTSLSIDIYPKTENKSQVVVQHLKIADSKKAMEMKAYWGEKLERLKGLLEGGW